MAELPQIVITAKDATGPGIASAQSGLKGLASSAASLAGSFSALGGVLAVGLFAQVFKDAIAAASALDDLADATGSSVESLSRIRNVVQVSGGSFDQLEMMVLKVGKGLAGIDDEGGKAAKALAALKISARDPADALQEVANKLDQFADGPGKIAVAMDLLGKEGARLLPLLKDMAQANDIGATYTTKQAKEAEELEKAWRRLGLEAGSLKTEILNNIVPALRDAITEFNLARKAGLGFWDSFQFAGMTGGPTGVAVAVAEAKKRLAELTSEYEKHKKWNSRPFWATSEDDVEKARKQLNALLAIQQRVNQLALDADESSDLGARRGALPQLKYGGDGRTNARDVADFTDEIQRLNDEMMKITGSSGGYEAMARASAAIEKAIYSGKIVTLAQIDTIIDLASELDEHNIAMKEWADLEKEVAEAEKLHTDELIKRDEAFSKLVQQEQASIDAIRGTTDGYLKQVDALTKTEDELLSLEQARLRGIVTDRLAETGIDDTTAALQEQIAAIQKLRDTKVEAALREQAKKTEEAWQSAARNIGDDLTDAFLRAAESGGDFFKVLANDLKRMFSQLVLRPIVSAVMQPLANTLTGAVGSFGNYGVGGTGLLGGIGSWFGGIGNSSAVGPIIPTFGSSFIGGMSSPFSTLSTLWSDGSAAFGGTTAALGAGLGAFLPLLGVGSMLASLFGGSRGGPKSGGFASTGGVGIDNMTPSDADSTLQGVVKSWQAAYASALAGMGGSGLADFLVSYDTDPQGTANNRMEASAYVNGQRTYHYWSGDDALGRDSAALQARIELEGKRAVVAALAASDLPQQIAAVFNVVDPAAMDSDAIDNLLSFGAAMKRVIDAIGGSVVEDAQAIWDKSQMSMRDSLRAMGDNIVTLAGEFDGSLASMQGLATATAEYRQAVVASLVAIKQVSQQIDEMFGGSRQTLETYGMSPEQQFAYWQAKAQSTYSQLLGSSDPAQIQGFASQINQYTLSAFNALPDELKAANRDAMLGFLNSVNAVVTGPGGLLPNLADQISGDTADPFAAANTVLGDAATKFRAAADVQTSAAGTMAAAANLIMRAATIQLTAAETPITVNVAGVAMEANG